MKKVLALVLAVAMVSTLAFALEDKTDMVKDFKFHHSLTAAGSIKVDKEDGVTGTKGNFDFGFYGANIDETEALHQNVTKDSGPAEDDGIATAAAGTLNYIDGVQDVLFRAVTNDNYSVTSLKITTGRSLVDSVTISDKDEQVKVKFVKDFDNVTAKNFDLSFTLKGKGKMIIKDTDEENRYNEYLGYTTANSNYKYVGKTASIPSVKFKMSGTVGFGKVTIYLGNEDDEDLENIEGDSVGGQQIDFQNDIIAFSRSSSRDIGDAVRSAGSFVADALLTQEYGDMTMEARVYEGDKLYLYCDNEPDRDNVLARLADVDGDVDFFFFDQTNAKYTTLNSNVKLIFDEAEKDDYVYEYKNGKLYEVGQYSEDDGCQIVKTRKLGQYIVSEMKLEFLEASSDDVANPDTGANDVVGIATALAAVALVSAAAVSLKK